MKQLKRVLGLLILISFIGCSPKSAEQAPSEMGNKDMVSTKTGTNQLIDLDRKLTKDGRVEFETTDISSTRKIIIETLEKYNAYTSSDQEFKSSGRISNTIVIRVPANNFDKLLSEATKGVSRFDSKEIEVKDVTEEFLDIHARLKTKKELENKYLELLKKAKSVTEILEVEKQLGELRSEIESIEGRLKYIENKVALSTLTITFYQKVPKETEFGSKFKLGFSNGWDNLIWFFVFLINIWPFVLITIGLVFGIRFWRKRKK